MVGTEEIRRRFEEYHYKSIVFKDFTYDDWSDWNKLLKEEHERMNSKKGWNEEFIPMGKRFNTI